MQSWKCQKEERNKKAGHGFYWTNEKQGFVQRTRNSEKCSDRYDLLTFEKSFLLSLVPDTDRAQQIFLLVSSYREWLRDF